MKKWTKNVYTDLVEAQAQFDALCDNGIDCEMVIEKDGTISLWVRW